MIDEKVLITLLGLKSEALRQITIEQRGGRAVQEEELDPEPEWEDYDQQDQNLLQHTTLEQLVSEQNAKEDPQINIDEAIQSAQASETPPPPATECAHPRPTLRERISAYLDARREWNVKRMAQDYSYECRKQRVIDRTYGFQYMADYIDLLIKKNQSDESEQIIHPQ
jgi:hypothetical protein